MEEAVWKNMVVAEVVVKNMVAVLDQKKTFMMVVRKQNRYLAALR